MTLPRDREEEFRIRIFTFIQDQIRKVIDMYKVALNMLESFVQDSSLSKLEEFYQKILKADESAKDTTRMIEMEMSNVGALLTNKEDFIRLVTEIDEIADTIEGVAYRMVNLAKMKARLSRELNSKLLELGDMVLSTLNRLREALLAITLNVNTFQQKIRETEEHEKKVDDIYRTLDLAILTSDLKIAPLLLTREIVWMLEEIADTAEKIVDTLRALSLTIF
ncbi:MAG: DUF47 family protein [Thaumarchaeota archaeon]|jgi:predicted phosphate transport protein (TIGR00153 family)|nr:DUF47 family protein [Candidatus Geocrenenecus arthurdayi]